MRTSLTIVSVVLALSCIAQKPLKNTKDGLVDKALIECEQLIAKKDLRSAQANIDIARVGMTIRTDDALKLIYLTKLNYLQGAIEELKGNKELAKSYYKEAFTNALKTSLGHSEKYALITKSKSAYVKIEVVNTAHDNVVKTGKALFEDYQKVNDYKGMIASLIWVGEAQMSLYDRPAALETFEQALALYKEHPSTESDYIKILMYTADIARQQGLNPIALEKLSEALTIAQRTKDRALTAEVQATQSELFLTMNQVEEAAEACASALSYYQSNKSDKSAKSWQRLAKIFTQLKSANTSASYLEKAMGGKKVVVTTEIAELGSNEIKTEERKINLALGLNAFQKSQKLAQANDFALQIETLLGKGRIYLEANNLPKAQAEYEAAYKLIKPRYPEKHPYSAECLLALGKIKLAAKDIDGSLALILQSLNSTMEDGAEVAGNAQPNIKKARLPYDLLNAMSTKGKAISAKYEQSQSTQQLVEALNTYTEATKLLNSLRRTHRSQGQRYELTKIAKTLAHQAVATSNKLYEKTKDSKFVAKGFDFTESTKSTTLLEALRDLEARRVAGVSPELLEKERSIKVDLAYLGEDIFFELRKGAMGNNTQLVAMQKKKAELTARYDSVLTVIEKKYPKYFDLKYNYQTSAISIIQASLQKDEILVEYMIADSTMYIFTADKQQIGLKAIPLTFSLHKKVKEFLQHTKGNSYNEFVNCSLSLHRILIAPIADKLQGKKSILIVPDAELNYLPFEMLIEKAPSVRDGDFSKLPYLLKTFAFTYNYSSTLYAQSLISESALNPSEGFLGMAPDLKKLNYKLISGRLSKYSDASGIFVDLPGARNEVTDIGEKVNGSIFASSEATESVFKENVSKYGALHIATHSVIDNNNPLYSKLILNGNESSNDNDGLLNTYELFDLKMNAGIATLSACNSGIGMMEEGEGMMSIARGFSFAGCPNVVMSLWPVSDASTATIMKSFYAYILDGKSKAEALRQAKLDYLETSNRLTSPPFFWAAFVLVGNSNELDLEKLHLEPSTNWAYWIMGVIGLLLIVGIALWIKGRRKATA